MNRRPWVVAIASERPDPPAGQAVGLVAIPSRPKLMKVENMATKTIVANGANNCKAVLVTGGAGYIGSHACKALSRAGYLPIAFDNLLYGHREAVQWGPLVVGDLADRSLLTETMRDFGVVAVMHFAALTYVGESIEKPELYFDNNLVNSLGLLGVMRLVG